jgi:hypothetical protein
VCRESRGERDYAHDFYFEFLWLKKLRNRNFIVHSVEKEFIYLVWNKLTQTDLLRKLGIYGCYAVLLQQQRERERERVSLPSRYIVDYKMLLNGLKCGLKYLLNCILLI